MSVSSVASTMSTEAASGGQGMRGHHKLPDQAVSALANKLGMSADDLKSKLESSDDPRKTLDSLAEEKGISRQELRETIRSAMPRPNGEDGAGGPDGHHGKGGPPAISFDSEAGKKLLSTLAEKLGTSADDLKSKLDAGGDLGKILKDGGVSREDVKAAFQEAFKAWQTYSASGSAGATATAQPELNAVDVQV